MRFQLREDVAGELRNDDHATRCDASAHFTQCPQDDIDEARCFVVVARPNEPDRAHGSQGAAEDGKNSGREYGRDAPFLPFRHLQLPNTGDGQDEQDEIGGRANDGGDE